MSNKVLVTGGAGYIGSHTVRELRKKAIEVVVLDDLRHGHRSSIPDIPLFQTDLSDEKKVAEIFAQEGPFEAVIHFASFIEAGRSVHDPLVFYQNNVSNSISLLKRMVEGGTKNFILSSSAAVYGEPCYVPIDEEHPIAPLNPYGISKSMVETILKSCEVYGIRYCSLRYFNAAGADPTGDIGEDHSPETHLIPLVLKVAMARKSGGSPSPVKVFGTDYPTPDGTCIRDYIHVCDLANAHVLAIQYLKAERKSCCFNVGNGNGYSVKEVVKTAQEVSQVDIPWTAQERRAGDPAVLVASSEKIRKELGWEPRYPRLETIVEHAWKWHGSHPEGYGE